MSDTFEFDDKARVERLVGTLHDPAATPGDVLTVQADKSIAANPGGGAGGVQVVTVPVTSAEILALFTTRVVLVAGVPGSVIVPTGLAAAYIAGATPYTDHGGSLTLGFAGGVGPAPWGFVSGFGFWDQATSQIIPCGFSNFGGTVAASAACDGVALVLSEDTANPTAGDGTLLVTLSYFLATV